MEIIGAGIGGIGGLIALIGYIWLIVVGFKQGGALWGILIFFFSFLAGLIFCIMHKTGWVPWILMVLGGILASLGMGLGISNTVMQEMNL
ncbi:MAG: hypothetical protein DWQ47_07700 [Acidobacteria bacterium]|nr:MAG: hypothetical protein DWQ32_15800 [Acidobacteriota bacterium]REJ99196.1 MAG: hypothetical protein DWQ38_14175 [Acidobacteriota bacterium]REK16083.1 MAG: hypothetical protein DWQ43_03510 [Acidobacteriota bacterium]REK43764.1 MAG: hypothetical protein DWQ47_07700 [Acidobacteriota bacterium]